MEHGNVSNTPASKVGLRFEEIIRRESDGKLNRSGKAFLENVGSLDIETVILTTGAERKAKAFCYKYGVPFSKILAVDSILDLEHVSRELNMIAYYDTDREILQRIKSRAFTKTEYNLWTLDNNSYLA